MISQAEGDHINPIRGERTPRFTTVSGIGGGVRIHFVGMLATYKYYNWTKWLPRRCVVCEIVQSERMEATNRVCEPVIAAVTSTETEGGENDRAQCRGERRPDDS